MKYSLILTSNYKPFVINDKKIHLDEKEYGDEGVM